MDRKKANRIYDVLSAEYKEATTALVHKNAFQLLVSTILSAQCTDRQVNKVTRTLFRKYRKPGDLAGASSAVLEKEIRSTGFYKNKAKNIIAAADMLARDFGGRVPDTMEELVKLPGVARKTANIVLFHGFGKSEGIAVDTHVKRVSARLGMTSNTDPVKIERDLMKLFDRTKWGRLSDVLIYHGRRICDARKPLCPDCPVGRLCLYAKEQGM